MVPIALKVPISGKPEIGCAGTTVECDAALMEPLVDRCDGREERFILTDIR
jgi:hypothetical protein